MTLKEIVYSIHSVSLFSKFIEKSKSYLKNKDEESKNSSIWYIYVFVRSFPATFIVWKYFSITHLNGTVPTLPVP